MFCGGPNQNWGPAVLDGMPNSDYSTCLENLQISWKVVIMQGTEKLLETCENTGCA